MSDNSTGFEISGKFAEMSAGGAFVYRADESRELIFADEGMISLFECENPEDFKELTGNSFNGIVNGAQLEAVLTEISLQLKDSASHSGYVFFNITTKNGNLRRMVNHYALIEDETYGELFYAYLFPHKLDNVGSDFDSLTGLYGKRRFNRYAENANNQLIDKDPEEYAVIYLNLVNFKMLNIDHGVSEGDTCLRILADLLKRIYDDAFISRVSGDHFAIFSRYNGLIKKCEQVRNTFFDVYGMRYNIILKFGIYRFVPSPGFDVESALSQAKIACDFIKYEQKEDIVEYSDKLADAIKTNDYVRGKIDEALEKGWIKVYFQPVIRSITGSLCSMESLARWIDPEVGFLSPDSFINTLEQERCIHKLDCYIVEQVCKFIHERLKKKQPMVPVSVNFSRLDFILCDMLKVVEDFVEKYDVPRDYIHIEITESMIASDAELMRNVITSFRNAGYEIWMDDFGSGYSSLTLLKDYQFDTLKLDMNFLTPFTEKSKSIVRSTVNMAKDIGMKTLCEGVETKEHLDFLKEIGCEMIQGYYYSAPKPIEEIFSILKEKNIPIETRKLRHLYQVAGFHVRATDTPLEIVEDDGNKIRTLFMNQKYREEIFDNDDFDGDIDEYIYNTGSPLLKKFREFADLIEETGNRETIYFTVKDTYFCFTGEVIAKYAKRYIIEGTVVNISHDRWAKETKQLDQRLRELNLLFEDVLLVNIKDNTLSPLLGNFKYLNLEPNEFSDLQNIIKMFVEKNVLVPDREECLAFLESRTLYDRVNSTGNGYIEHAFQVKQPDGNYKWMEIYLMLIPGTNGSEYLYCMKSFTEKSSDLLEKEQKSDILENRKQEFSNVFGNILMDSSIKFFWKDKDRRFLGVSHAFLEYFGFSSPEAVIGKTDDDMRWIIDDEDTREKEFEVINKGKRFYDLSNKVIVHGVVRNTICSKMPLYKDGEIIGLMGYFVDRDSEIESINNKFMATRVDGVTGLMNSHAFIDTMIEYAMNYNSDGVNYGLILLNNPTHDRIIETYDKNFAFKVLKMIGDHILSITENTCPVARMKESVFAVLVRTDSSKDLESLALKIKKWLNGIKKIENNPVTIRMKVAYKLRTDHPSSDESLYEDLLKTVTDQ